VENALLRQEVVVLQRAAPKARLQRRDRDDPRILYRQVNAGPLGPFGLPMARNPLRAPGVIRIVFSTLTLGKPPRAQSL
jgi:hypothetical protein